MARCRLISALFFVGFARRVEAFSAAELGRDPWDDPKPRGPDATPEEREAYMGTREGQPWAHVVWHPAQDTDMIKPLLRGFSSNVLIAGLLFWLLGQFRTMNIGRGALVSLVLAYIGYTYFIYSDHIWYDIPDHVVHLVDTVVPWTLIGALGGWLHSRNHA